MLKPALRLSAIATPDRVTPPDAVVVDVEWDDAAAGGLTVVAGLELAFEYMFRSAGRFGTREHLFEIQPDDVPLEYAVPPRHGVAITGAGRGQASLFLPVTRPSVDVRGLHLRHAVRVDAIDDAGASVATARAPFSVLLARGGYAHVARTAPVKDGADVSAPDVTVAVRDRQVEAGGRVQGTITVPDGSRRTTVALVRSLFFSTLGSQDQKERLDVTVTDAAVAREPGSVSFALDVPADASPTCFTGPSALRWFVRATASAGRAPWARRQQVDVEIEMANA